MAMAAGAALFLALCVACGDHQRVRYLAERVAGWLSGLFG